MSGSEAQFHLAVREGVELSANGPTVTLVNRWGRREFGVGSPEVAALVAGLKERPRTLMDLCNELMSTLGPAAISQVSALHIVVRTLSGAGLLDWLLLDGDAEVARLTGEGVLGVRASRAPEGELTIRGCVVAQPDAGRCRLLSVTGHERLVVDAALLGRLFASPVVRGDELPWAGVVDLAWSAGLLEPVGSDNLAEQLWSPAELWMHSRSRDFMAVDRFGGTYRMLDRMPPPEVSPEPNHVHDRMSLPEVNLEASSLADPSLTDAMEQRRSVRDFSTTRRPSAQQIGEVLYRTVRARRTFTAEHGFEVVDKPVPAGGSIHEIDVYLAVSAVDGVDRGLWRYDCVAHELQLVVPPGPEFDRLVVDARTTARIEEDPPVVMLFAARFDRIGWKYETIAYSLVLKHVGVLMEAMYLVCPTVGLGVCALGGGSSRAFAAATGLDPLLVGTTGEMVLGVPG